MERLFIVFFLSASAFAVSSPVSKPYELPRDPDAHYAKDAAEAVMTFDYQVKFDSKDEADKGGAREEIEDQVQHLFGPMAASPLRSVPKADHEISNIRLEKLANGSYRAAYHYSGHIQIQHGSDGDYDLLLPINPDKVHKASVVMAYGTDGLLYKTFPCISDPHYTKEEDFWYFWNPNRAGCPLREGVDYERVTAHIERLPNTTNTYPEYSRLVDDNGVLRIDLLVGMDDDKRDRNPFTTTDPSAENFIRVRSILLQWGYRERAWPTDEITAVTGQQKEQLPYVMEMWKQEARAKIVVRMFFGPTLWEEESRAFHFFLRDTLKNASMMIYSGHSGLGDNLMLKHIEDKEKITLQPNVDRYQIYYFNSCSSYPYYTNMYFGRKKTDRDPKGTKNLDILTNGLMTYFHIPHDTNEELIRAVGLWATNQQAISYQEIVNVIDSDNLMAVNGDEDNPTEPEF